MFKFDSVSVLNSYVSDVLAQNTNLKNFELTAEISEFKIAYSGHCYFKVKDENSSVNCVMFKSYFMTVDFKPQIGDNVVLRGSVELYSPSGSYQLKITSMKRKGEGDLHEKFLQLFAKLKEEGLFDPSHKLKVPVLPKKIGVVTSPTGAVIHDIIDTLRRRNPNFHIVLYPVLVQGEKAPEEICSGLNFMDKVIKPDVVIVARGGGSYEDLFCFNDERIARVIYNMAIPVISAIGHEVDYTICDYVSDLRAPTPTAAAELVLGKYDDLSDNVAGLSLSIDIAMKKYLEARYQQIQAYSNHKALISPLYYAQNQTQVILNYKHQLDSLIKSRIELESSKISSISASMDSLNPDNVLKRGYAFLDDGSGNAIESVNSIKKGSNVKIVLSDGKADALIEEVFCE